MLSKSLLSNSESRHSLVKRGVIKVTFEKAKGDYNGPGVVVHTDGTEEYYRADIVCDKKYEGEVVPGDAEWVRAFNISAKEMFPEHCVLPYTKDGVMVYPGKHLRSCYCREYILDAKTGKLASNAKVGVVYSIHSHPDPKHPTIGTILTRNGKLKAHLFAPNTEHKAEAILNTFAKK